MGRQAGQRLLLTGGSTQQLSLRPPTCFAGRVSPSLTPNPLPGTSLQPPLPLAGPLSSTPFLSCSCPGPALAHRSLSRILRPQGVSTGTAPAPPSPACWAPASRTPGRAWTPAAPSPSAQSPCRPPTSSLHRPRWDHTASPPSQSLQASSSNQDTHSLL